jgi:hypothetical protein
MAAATQALAERREGRRTHRLHVLVLAQAMPQTSSIDEIKRRFE